MDFSHTRGDTFIRTLSFKDNLGAAIDLTGATIKFTIKSNIDDASPLLQATASIPTPLTGLATVTFTAAQMTIPVATYYYDLQFTDSANTVTTVLKGSFVVTYEITT
jgi:hypothetical protein